MALMAVFLCKLGSSICRQTLGRDTGFWKITGSLGGLVSLKQLFGTKNTSPCEIWAMTMKKRL